MPDVSVHVHAHASCLVQGPCEALGKSSASLFWTCLFHFIEQREIDGSPQAAVLWQVEKSQYGWNEMEKYCVCVTKMYEIKLKKNHSVKNYTHIFQKV